MCAARAGIGDGVLAGLPDLPVDGLGDSDARTLLLENLLGPVDAAVCEQIITECHGNPLALLELPRTWNAAELAGGFGIPARQPVASKIEQSFAKRLQLLPAETQLFVLAAAAEPLGDPLLLHRAAEGLGLDSSCVRPCGGRRAPRRERARRVRASPRPLGRLRLRVGRRPSACAPSTRRGHRRRARPRPPRVASRACHSGARRGCRRRARALGRARSSSRWRRCGGSLPRTGERALAGFSEAGTTRAQGCGGQAARRARLKPPRHSSPSRWMGRSTSSKAPRRSA